MRGYRQLTEERVLEIYRRTCAGERGRPLAREFGCTTTTIYGIKSGKQWGWLTGQVYIPPPRGPRTKQNAKLTEEQVREIYRRIWAGESGHKLAKEYGMSAGSIYSIKTGNTWRHVTQTVNFAPRDEIPVRKSVFGELPGEESKERALPNRVRRIRCDKTNSCPHCSLSKVSEVSAWYIPAHEGAMKTHGTQP